MIIKSYLCDRCNRKLEENQTWKLTGLRDYMYGEGIERHFFELCTDCYKKLIEDLKIKGKHDSI